MRKTVPKKNGSRTVLEATPGKGTRIVGNVSGKGQTPPKSPARKTPQTAPSPRSRTVPVPEGGLQLENYPTNTTLAGVVGSTAYGLNQPGKSDIDTLGVFVTPADLFLGIDPPKSLTWTSSANPYLPDSTFHDVGKFCHLALKGNPTVMELLWLQEYTANEEAMDELVALRTDILSSTTVWNSYAGYARSEMHSIVKERDKQLARLRKRARHATRLCLQGLHLLSEGVLVVNVAEWRDYIFEQGELCETHPELFEREIENRVAELTAARETSHLPETVPEKVREQINAFVVRQRKLYSVEEHRVGTDKGR